MKFTTKHASNSPVTFVTHKRSVVLFFLPSCCVNSLRSLTSQRLQEKTPLCRPFFENLHFLVPECLKRWEKTFSFQNYQDTCGRTLDTGRLQINPSGSGDENEQVPFLFFSAHDWSWDRANMGRATNWRANLSTELTNGRPATGKRHRNLICHCVCLPTPRPFWFEYTRFIFPLRNNRVNGNVCHKATIVLWLIHFLSTKNDYAIPRFIKSNPLCSIKL